MCELITSDYGIVRETPEGSGDLSECEVLHYFWSDYEHCTNCVVLQTNLSLTPAFQDL
jgi:hypothetical protein